MTEEELKKKVAELTANLEKAEAKSSEDAKAIDEVKAAKADLVKQRDEFKKEIAGFKDKNTTDNATAEELKKLLNDVNHKLEESEKARQSDKVLSKLEKEAKNAGFVTDKEGNVNMQLLKSQIDISGLHLDDDGKLFGAVDKLKSLKENYPSFFPKKSAPSSEPKIDPQSIKGRDLSPEKVQKMPFQEQVKAMNEIGKISEEQEKANGLPPGMGLASKVDSTAGASSE